MCGAFERKENDFCKLDNLTYSHDTAIRNSEAYPLNLKNQNFHDLFVETLFWINLCPAKNYIKLQIFGSLVLIMTFLQDCFGG